MKVEGFLYEPPSSRRTTATLRRIGDTHHIIAEGDRKWRQVGIRSAAPPLAGIPETITLTTRETFAPHAPLPEGFLDGGRAGIRRRLTRLEGFSVPKAACLVLVLILALFALRAALPWVADGAAPLVSRDIEIEMGRNVLRELDRFAFRESRLPSEHRRRIKAKAETLTEAAGYGAVPEIMFRDGGILGANAFAVPGGPVVLTDRLVGIMPSDEAVVAVIAHEIGHVDRRHGIRQVLRAAGLFLLAGLVLGGDETIIGELVAAGIPFATSAYSRRFEEEADGFAALLLARGGGSPDHLAQALEALRAECGDKCPDGHWLSSHPSTGDRIRRLRNLP